MAAMVIPEIRSIACADRHYLDVGEPPLAVYRPEDANDFEVLLLVMVGHAGAEGAEQLQVLVTTPLRVERTLRQSTNAARFGWTRLLVLRWDWPTIDRVLRAAVLACAGESWGAVGHNLSRVGLYEFDSGSLTWDEDTP